MQRGGHSSFVATALVLATTNPGKLAEMRALLAAEPALAGVALVASADFADAPAVAETGATFAENARLKAAALARATGLPALADDSGLCVDALDGAPGLHSARWAGPLASDADRTRALLAALADVPDDRRAARFVCALAAVLPDGRTAEAEGVCEGVIARAPRGTQGFGYDPVFLLPESGRTLAEMTPDEKNRDSHRARALRRLTPALAPLLSNGAIGCEPGPDIFGQFFR
jgi:XTP/dITP diphosphohydrolase